MIAHELACLAAVWPRHCWGWSIRMSDSALDFCIETAKQMGFEQQFLLGRSVDADVLSAAIEAAEALAV